MSMLQIQSEPSKRAYAKLTQRELEMRLDAAGKTLQDALALCARNKDIALAEGHKISLIGEITDALYACEAACLIVGCMKDFDKCLSFLGSTTEMIGNAITWIRNKLGASTLANCCFFLSYDINAAAKHPRAFLSPDVDADVPKKLLVLEEIFQTLLSLHCTPSVTIVLFRKSSGGIWVSDGSIPSLPLRQFLLAKSLELQQERDRGNNIPSGVFSDPTSAKFHLQALADNYFQQGAGMVQNKLNSSLNPQQAFKLLADYHGLTDFYAQAQLQKVAARKDPQIRMGLVDLSCAFVVCNPSMPDCPVVYASPAFETLTGYAKHEVLSRNCRFLQSPDGQMHIANKPSLVELKHKIAQGREYQLTLINYKKGGQPFANLLTVVPILDGRIFFYIGFLIDIAERPGCIFGKNANGTYRVNYSTTQLPQPVDVPTVPADDLAPVLQGDNPAEPMELLSMTTPEADSPWTVTDGPAPPYALSPGVFYHTSRMGMLSP
jgi:PAS domain S-box-containing protein